MAMKSRQQRIGEKLDMGYTTDQIANMFGLDEDEVIASISDVPQRPKPVREQIKNELKKLDFNVLGLVVSEKRRRIFKEGTTFSNYSDSQYFIEIEKSKPSMRFLVLDDSIIIRKWIEGDYTDFRYEKSEKLMTLLENI